MKPEDRKRLKQHIEIIVEHKTKSYEELEAENKSLRHILSLWKKTEAMKEIDELKEIIRDFIIGFSIDVFGVRPNGNSAFGCDEWEVRGNEYLRELLKRAELYAHTDIVDEMSVGVKNTNPDYYNHDKTSTDNNKLDIHTLEYAAKWIENSLVGETNERVIEFGKNMAMSILAAKPSPSDVSVAQDVLMNIKKDQK